MTTDFTPLDNIIVARIKDGPATFTQLHHHPPIRLMAESLAKPDRFGEKDGWRLLDRRLQALRKKGSIRFDRKAQTWLLTEGTE